MLGMALDLRIELGEEIFKKARSALFSLHSYSSREWSGYERNGQAGTEAEQRQGTQNK
jgi:hypothetical protein